MRQIFYFTAEWCGPCKALGPVMEKVAEVMPVEKINIDYETDRTKAAGIMSVPTVVLAETVKKFVDL